MQQRYCGIRERWWKTVFVLAALAGLVCVVTESDHSATGQNLNGRAGRIYRPEADEEIVDGVFLPPDRTAKRRLDAAEEMITEGRFGESVRYLGSLLEGSEDFFFRPEASGTVYRSLKAEAGRLIASLPAAGRESYELQFGPKARRMLDAAVTTGNLVDLSEASRRFFYTQAGSEASLLLARQHLDEGQPLAAALLFARLRESPDLAERFEPMLSLYLATAWLRAGMPDQAQAVLVALKHQWRDRAVRIAGQSVKLFDNDSTALAWLEERVGKQREVHHLEGEDWLMYRGDARHNAPARGGRPLLNPRWRVRVAHHPTVETLVRDSRQRFLDDDVAALPSLHPLAVGNLVLMRDSRSLLAVDFTTGKLVWPAEPLGESSIDHWLSFSSQPQQVGQADLKKFVDQRVWDDQTYGTMSSDGEQVFVVEDSGSASSGKPAGLRGAHFNSGGGLKSSNVLIARELKTEGKLKWEVGGPSGEDEPKLAGAFFLGPPLVLQGRLYALAEVKGQEIRLVALSAKTGRLDWSQQLCVVEQSILQDSDRRAGGATPSFADGVLVCPTSAGAIVAVDATTRNLLWGYQYPRSQQNNMNAMRIGMFANERPIGYRWADSTVTIADGKVVVTPIDSDFLYVLNLINGELQWKTERGVNRYVACVNGGNVITVGRNQVNAYPLGGGGRPAWNCPTSAADSPDGGMPSGRGFQTGHDYYLPLASSEVVQIDLTKGQIVSRAKSHSGEVPGNLICHRGQVISQGAKYVEVFFQIELLQREIAQTLEQAPNDPKALARLGEIKFDEGDLQQSIDLFRRSYELSPDDHTRGLLVGSLLEGLRRDFVGSRAKAAELEKLIDRQSERNVYLRLVATGLKQAGDSLASYDAYISLLDEPSEMSAGSGDGELEPVGEGLRVRRQRWIQTELGELRSHASAADGQQIDERVAVRLQAALDASSVGALHEFLEVFGRHPLADVARERLVASLSGAQTLIERELLLRRLMQSSDEARARAATVRMAMLFDEADRPDLSVFYYRQLRGAWADIPCLDGKTGAELIAALPPDAPVTELLARSTDWPKGQVTWKENNSGHGGGKLANQHQRSADVAIYGPVAPFFAGVTLALEQQQQSIVGLDGLGFERFRAQLEPDARKPFGWNAGGFPNPLVSYARTNGNLLVMWTGQQVVAIDTLRPGKTVKRVKRLQDFVESGPGFPMHQGFHQQAIKTAWGGLPQRVVTHDASGRLIGSMGPVNSDGICFQRFRDLNCIDPLTGTKMWTRKNVAVGCDVFGDEELLFIAPPEGGDALVLRALDGQLLGKRPVRPLEQRMATIGRATLIWETVDSKHVVTLRDVWSDEVKWSQTFRSGAKGAVLADEMLGVLEQSGHFVLIRLADGHKLVDEQLDPEKTLTGIGLLCSSDQILLVTNSPPTGVEGALNIQAAPGGTNNPVINGRIYAFDRATGEKMWPRPVVVQQQGLVFTQPSELPLLFLMSHRHKVTPADLPEPKSVVQVINKRNGRVVFNKDDLPGMIQNFALLGDRETNSVTLTLPGHSFTFHLTDEPLPPLAEPPPAPKTGFLGGLGGAILRSIERSARPININIRVENGNGEPPVEEDDD